jgi:GT2 family glycosyltransferase
VSQSAYQLPESGLALTVSIVVYRSDPAVLQLTLDSMLQAIHHAQNRRLLSSACIDIILNSASEPAVTELVARCRSQAAGIDIALLEGHGNIGYGRGHNLSIKKVESHCHLILNPDVTLSPESLAEGLEFMIRNPEVVALSPAVEDGEGHKQYVCKRFPSVLDFMLRGFAPAFVRRLFAARLARYEMRDLPEQEPSTDIPIISGCFMLFRTAALRTVGGFDERYFLYFEDFDLSLRVHSKGSLAYLPSMHIVHLGGNSARKGLRHIGMFARSGLRFYNTHGWRLL